MIEQSNENWVFADTFQVMKKKSICFCIPSRKHKESNNGDSDSSPQKKHSHHKSKKGGKSRGHASTAPADHVGANHSDAANANSDAGMAVAMMGASHVSTVASSDGCGDGSGHGGGGDGWGWYAIESWYSISLFASMLFSNYICCYFLEEVMTCWFCFSSPSLFKNFPLMHLDFLYFWFERVCVDNVNVVDSVSWWE